MKDLNKTLHFYSEIIHNGRAGGLEFWTEPNLA